MRLLPYVRLSVLDDDPASPERQMQTIEAFTQVERHQLIPVTEADYDLDVSGSVDPFKRPGLGPWLSTGRLELWDGICVTRLDRLTRSVPDFIYLTSWLRARGKELLCLDPHIDLETPEGFARALTIVRFAQFEQEAIAKRVRDGYHEAISKGHYAGGQVPFGYRPIKLSEGWGYEPDPTYAQIVSEIFNRYVLGESLGSITRWLNETNTLTPWNATRQRNGKPLTNSIWRSESTRKILTSPAVLGITVSTKGTPIRDANGSIIYRSDPLVPTHIWNQAQAKMASNRRSEKVNSWMLTQVAFCAACNAPMYGSTAKYRDKVYRYYCCVHSLRRDGKCTAPRVNADDAEQAISLEILHLFGESRFSDSSLSPKSSRSEEITYTIDRIAQLFEEIQIEALSGKDVRDSQRELQRARDKLCSLQELEFQATDTRAVISATLKEQWGSLNAKERNELLRSLNVRALVSRNEILLADTPAEKSAEYAIPDISISLTSPKLRINLHLADPRKLPALTSAA